MDPRVRRTRKYLNQALLALLEDRELAAISVRDIVRTAGINRATFYLHFRDKDDFARQAVDALFDELVGDVRAFVDARRPITADQPPDVLIDMFRRLGARPGLFARLLSTTGPGTFAARLVDVLEAETLRQWPALQVPIGESEAPPAFRARFVASATLGTMTWWLRNGAVESPDTVTAWLWELLHPIWFEHSVPGVSDQPVAASPSA